MQDAQLALSAATHIPGYWSGWIETLRRSLWPRRCRRPHIPGYWSGWIETKNVAASRTAAYRIFPATGRVGLKLDGRVRGQLEHGAHIPGYWSGWIETAR